MGRIDYLSLDGATAQGCKRLLVASRNGVVASINTQTGELGKPIPFDPRGRISTAGVSGVTHDRDIFQIGGTSMRAMVG